MLAWWNIRNQPQEAAPPPSGLFPQKRQATAHGGAPPLLGGND